MASAALAWLLFLVGRYVDLMTFADATGRYAGSGTSTSMDAVYDEPQRVTPGLYLTVAALMIVGLGALFAKRRLTALRASDAPRSTLVRPVLRFASVVVIVAAALAVLEVLVTFLGGFFGLEVEEPEPLIRALNVYLPILLNTALVVTLILAGFVFIPSAPRETRAQGSPPWAGEQTAGDSGGRSRVAFAYVTPIIATAIALVIGLVVYDLTRTALQVWLWVGILAIIGAGVLAGTILARRSAGTAEPEPAVVVGAKKLNFVLSVLFVVSASAMSLGYGAAAVYGLNIAPDLSISASGEGGVAYDDTGGAEVTSPVVSMWGFDLKPGSEATVTLEPGGETVLSATVQHNRWLTADGELPEDLSPGDYELIGRAVSTDDRSFEVTLPLTVPEAGDIVFPDGTDGFLELDTTRLLPITPRWVLGDLVPAGVLLLLGMAVVATTTTARNRDDVVSAGTP